MPNPKAEMLGQVASYYSAKLAEHGDTAQGVDWNGEDSQVTRFEQLCRILDSRETFSVNDLGCGYGALYEYLSSRYQAFTYHGYDISGDMIRAARTRYGSKDNADFTVAARPPEAALYGMASGIFNVRLNCGDAEWREHLGTMLDALHATSTKAFAFNCLTAYSDKDKMKDYLYYADPCELFDFCKRRYSRQVALLHDYGLYEFTILVKKDA